MYLERKSESRRQVSEKMQGFGEEVMRENQKIKPVVSCKIWKVRFGFHIFSYFFRGIPGFSSILTCPLLSLFSSITKTKNRKVQICIFITKISKLHDVGDYILKDTNKVDTFFALPKAFQRT